MSSQRPLRQLLSSSAAGALLGLLSIAPVSAQAQQPAQGQQMQSAQQNTACTRLVQRLRQGAENSPITLERAQALQRENDVAECRRVIQQIRVASGELQNRIVVQQQAPQVDVDQAAPRITVQQPNPNVTVRQPMPQIIVRQAPPTITVQQAQPEIIVRMPDPEVNVAMAQPRVTVNQPEPEVQVVEPDQQPQLQVQQAEPVVRVQPADAVTPTIQQSGAPRVQYEQVGEARVVMRESAEEPIIRYEQAGDSSGQQTSVGSASTGQPTSIQSEQATDQNQVDPDQAGSTGQDSSSRQPTDQSTTPAIGEQPPNQTNAPAADQDTAGQTTAAVGQRGRSIAAQNLVDLEIWNDSGQQLGNVERVVRASNGREHAIVSFGGFLGLGEREVAVPIASLRWGGDRLIMSGATTQQLQSMPDVSGSTAAWTELGNDEAVTLER